MTDTTIYHAMLVGASMGIAICASPEILILGLLMAANRAAPRRNTALFFIGGFIGLSALVILGASLTPSDPTGPIQPSIHRFIVKATFGTALTALGTYRAWQYFFGAAPEPKAPNEKQSHIKNLLDVLFPSLSERPIARRQMGLHYFLSSLMIGFISTALNPKMIPFAMLVGHELALERAYTTRTLCLLTFASLAILPWIFPLGLSIFTPGAAPQMRSWLTKFMEKNGRWIIALICLGFGAHMYKGAFDMWPG